MKSPTTPYYFTTFQTKACDVTLVGSDLGLHILHLDTGEGKKDDFTIDPEWIEDDSCFSDVKQQLIEYFAGERQKFELTSLLVPQGTDFQQNVWQALQQIPTGLTCRYMDIANQIHKPKAVRAVGAAIGKNPIPIIIPCHRVVGANGSLTGFAHGIPMKKKLLELEGIRF